MLASVLCSEYSITAMDSFVLNASQWEVVGACVTLLHSNKLAQQEGLWK